MKYQSIEEHLSSEYGYEQYQAYDHSRKNRDEIMKSEICGCFFCHETFKPEAIISWTDNDLTACCPERSEGGGPQQPVENLK
jgi:hypothetical protein